MKYLELLCKKKNRVVGLNRMAIETSTFTFLVTKRKLSTCGASTHMSSTTFLFSHQSTMSSDSSFLKTHCNSFHVRVKGISLQLEIFF